MNAAQHTTRREVVRFADGSGIEFRPLELGDGDLISSFLGQLATESEYKRLLSAPGAMRSQWVASLIHADQSNSLAFGAVAVNEFGSSPVAIAESIRDPGDRKRAEFAVAAVDPWQTMGIGTLLTRHVARIARSTGIRHWKTCMLADNGPMSRMTTRMGRTVSRDVEFGLATLVHELEG